MQRHPDDTTRAVLAIAIWVAFLGSIATLLLHSVPKGNATILTQAMTTLGSSVALVANYYFRRGK